MFEPRPRAILFDLFHTLIRLRSGGDLGPPTWETLGVPREPWHAAFYTEGDGRAEGDVRDAVEAVRMVAHRVDPTVPMERIRLAVALRARRFEDAMLNVAPQVLRGVRRLAGAGIRLALVSNASWDEIEHWERSPLAEHFETAVFSCAVGLVKPDRAIYEHTLARLDLTPADAVFVGDGGSDELLGARALGMRTVFVGHVAREIWPDKAAQRALHADLALHDPAELADRVLGEETT